MAGVFALYRFYAADDTLLYVGLTINPGRRMEKHAAGKPWWSNVARVTIEQLPSLKALQAAERKAIQSEKPLHNIRMNKGTKAERRQALRDHGWNRISGHGSESWTHQDHPHVTFSLSGAWETASITLPPKEATQTASHDGIVGRWFHSYRPLRQDEEAGTYATRKGHLVREWQGQVIGKEDDLYIVQLYSWWDGEATNQAVVGKDDLKHWSFFESNRAMVTADGCIESDHGDICGRPCTHMVRDWHGMGPIYRCNRCITHYSGKIEALV